eukprot:symbB.v1.2.014343.t1/scaffold1047.1/size141927/9
MSHESTRQDVVFPRWLADFKEAGDGKSNADMSKIRPLRHKIWRQTEHNIQKMKSKESGFSSTKCIKSTGKQLRHDGLNSRSSPIEPVNAGQVAPALRVEVIDGDLLEHAAELCRKQNLKVAVLNMASPNKPGGGVRNGAGAQEETMFRRSDLANFLDESKFYPIHDESCLVSPDVTILRGKEQDGYPFLEEGDRYLVTFLTCPAPERLMSRRVRSECAPRLEP